MKRAVILMIACMFVWTQATPASESRAVDVHSGHAMPPGGSMLPTRDTARNVLNSSGRHPDWLRIPAGSAEILTWATYPDRIDKAPVVRYMTILAVGPEKFVPQLQELSRGQDPRVAEWAAEKLKQIGASKQHHEEK